MKFSLLDGRGGGVHTDNGLVEKSKLFATHVAFFFGAILIDRVNVCCYRSVPSLVERSRSVSCFLDNDPDFCSSTKQNTANRPCRLAWKLDNKGWSKPRCLLWNVIPLISFSFSIEDKMSWHVLSTSQPCSQSVNETVSSHESVLHIHGVKSSRSTLMMENSTYHCSFKYVQKHSNYHT